MNEVRSGDLTAVHYDDLDLVTAIADRAGVVAVTTITWEDAGVHNGTPVAHVGDVMTASHQRGLRGGDDIGVLDRSIHVSRVAVDARASASAERVDGRHGLLPLGREQGGRAVARCAGCDADRCGLGGHRHEWIVSCRHARSWT